MIYGSTFFWSLFSCWVWWSCKQHVDSDMTVGPCLPLAPGAPGGPGGPAGHWQFHAAGAVPLLCAGAGCTVGYCAGVGTGGNMFPKAATAGGFWKNSAERESEKTSIVLDDCCYQDFSFLNTQFNALCRGWTKKASKLIFACNACKSIICMS